MSEKTFLWKQFLLSKKIPNARNETNDAACMPPRISVLYLENKNAKYLAEQRGHKI